MKARKTVIAPKIVQEDPGQRVFWYVLLLAGFLAVAWFSYDYGRTRAPVGAGVDVAQVRDSERRIKELEQERDTLKEQLLALERDVEMGRQALEEARAQVQALQRTQTVPARVTAAPESVAAPAEAAVIQDEADNRLLLENIQLVGTDTENLFRYGFSVMHLGDDNDLVAGTIWIAVNGMADGKPTRLSLHRISPDKRKFLKMSFKLQQDVQGEVMLPPEFRPKNIMIEAKPYNTKYTGTSETVDWLPTEPE